MVDDEDDDGGEWTPITKEKQVQLFEPKQEVTHEVSVQSECCDKAVMERDFVNATNFRR